MSRKQKRMLCRVLVSAALLIFVSVLRIEQPILRALLFAVPYLVAGFDVLKTAAIHIVHGQVFDENFLMSLATVGAFATGEYAEGVAVMVFYQIGELFQSIAVGRSRRSIAALMDIRPDSANLETETGISEVAVEDVKTDQIIVVKPGERIPLDGIILEGASSIDTAALTGESLPRSVSVSEEVISGCINLDGLLRVRVTRPSSESTVTRILELVETSAASKAKSEHFITRFARWYTPFVVIAALLLALIPPLVDGAWNVWPARALVFLVVSCPCALVISVPLTFFGGIGGASRMGVLVKGGNYLEALAEAKTVVFDKTGTLTEGTFTVTAVHPFSAEKQTVLMLAAHAECFSDHPIARSLRAAYALPIDKSRIGAVEEIAGSGVIAVVDGQRVLVGNQRLLSENGIEAPACTDIGTIVYVASEERCLGAIVIADIVKSEAADSVSKLKQLGIEQTVMLTGDREEIAEYIANELGIDSVHARLLPQQKVEAVEKLLIKSSSGGKLVYVGDGINDAPVLSRADIGVAMGALGSDAAIEAADIVLMDDDPKKLVTAIRIARRTRRIVTENIVLALSVKTIVLLLGALGYAGMWLAVFADVGVCVIAILNAMRMLRYR